MMTLFYQLTHLSRNTSQLKYVQQFIGFIKTKHSWQHSNTINEGNFEPYFYNVIVLIKKNMIFEGIIDVILD